MSRNSETDADGERSCVRQDCDDGADFWLYEPCEGRWRPICTRHTVELHPSLEVNAWLESGYARPIEMGHPEAPPTEPRGGRPAAFRELVVEAMDWGD